MNHYEQIKAMFSLVKPRTGWCRPEFALLEKRQYRGKERWVAGYSHGRLGSGRSGLVTDRVLGYGETREEAIEAMRKALAK